MADWQSTGGKDIATFSFKLIKASCIYLLMDDKIMWNSDGKAIFMPTELCILSIDFSLLMDVLTDLWMDGSPFF
jgi:hypothetical protein